MEYKNKILINIRSAEKIDFSSITQVMDKLHSVVVL